MNGMGRFEPAVTLLALILAAGAVWSLHVEAALGLPRLMPLVVAGFAVHSALPARLRVGFFLLLGLAGAVLLLGPLGAAVLVGFGLALLGTCHLPTPRWLRLALVLGWTAGLAALRLGWVDAPRVAAVVPVVASLFMFRLLIYLYDLPHERVPARTEMRLAYFFMLPNLCFPLFPVVDYQRFTTSHYAAPADTIHRKGVGWLLLGVVQILAYRAFHLTLVTDLGDIQNAQDVASYALHAYLQYLRISGMFHIAVAVLCLFGFDLPATNRWYFLSPSYTELWRRINIYWKDFLQKIVYFPVFMALRKRLGTTRSLVAATAAVFVASWLLHAWQWFWLQGEVLLTDVDVLFWGLVGAAVVASALWDARRTKAPLVPRPPLQRALVRATGTALMFTATCGLWWLWSSRSLDEWLFMLQVARHIDAAQAARVGGLAAAAFALGVGLCWLDALGRLPDLDGVLRRGSTQVGLGGALLTLGLGAPYLPDDSKLLALVLEPNAGPLGYYEGLLESGVALEGRDLVPAGLDDESMLDRGERYLHTNDLRRYALRPSATYTFRGKSFRTNEHGMRDESVAMARTPGVVRIALLGASPEMGVGVAGTQDFPALVDEMLGPEVEILNFAVTGYGPVQNTAVLETALAFDPDIVLIVGHGMGDRSLTVRLLLNLAAHPRRFPRELAAFQPPKFGGSAARRAWAAAQYEPVTRWAYETIAARSREHGAVPVWVYVPLPSDPPSEAPAEVERWARASGLDTLRLEDLYRGWDRSALSLPRDNHPNSTAHHIIAEKLAPALGPWIDQVRR